MADRLERTDAAVGLLTVFNDDRLKVRTPRIYVDLVLNTPSYKRPVCSPLTTHNAMPSAFTTQLIAQYGPAGNYKYSDAVQLKTATTLKSTGFAMINKCEPWNNTKAKGLLDHHPVAWWNSLSVSVSALPGVYGRMCTIYGGWASEGMSSPKTVDDMLGLHAAFTKTCGGTGDPGVFSTVIPCPFDDTMTDTLKTPYNGDVRPVFYYCFIEVDLIDKAPDSDRFLLHFNGGYEVQGRF